MRIAQMIDSLHWGGAQKMQIFLVQSLQPLGIDLTVISLRQDSNSSVAAQLEAAGARVVTFSFPRLFSIGSFVHLVQFLRHESFDLLHTYLTYSNIIGSFAGQLSGTPVITSLRSAGVDPRYFRPRRVRLENLALRYAARKVTANGYVVADVGRKRLPNVHIDVIPNAIDLIPPLAEDQRQTLRAQITGDPQRPMLLSVGRLALPKGFPDLLDAFACLHSDFPSAALVIAGEGDMAGELRTTIARLGLDGHVFMLGLRNDVPALLGAADLYVNSSHWEGMPVSVLEAMAAGLPVIATAVGDTPWVVKPGTGVLVPPYRPKELAMAMANLLASPEQRSCLGLAARDHIQRNFNRDVWRRNLLNLYAQVVPGTSGYLAALDRLAQTE
jgi:L-malate glycosyltransferase